MPGRTYTKRNNGWGIYRTKLQQQEQPYLSDSERWWIQQFDLQDRGTAREMLNKMQWISRDSYFGALGSLVHEYLDPSVTHAAYLIHEKANRPYFRDRRRRPWIVEPSSGSPGSEYQLANFLKAISKGIPKILPGPSISSLKRGRIQSILLFDDFIGSGDQAQKFIKWFFEHSAFRSPASLPHFKVCILVHTATKRGVKCLRDIDRVPNVKKWRRKHEVYSAHPPIPSPRELWGEFYPEVRHLEDKYATRHNLRFRGGYGKVYANVIFRHGCPNNAPSILHQGNSGWRPLFPDRRIPGDIVWRFGNTSFQGEAMTLEWRILMALYRDLRRHPLPNEFNVLLPDPEENIQSSLAKLRQHGLVSKGDNGRYSLSETGMVEMKSGASRAVLQSRVATVEREYPMWVPRAK